MLAREDVGIYQFLDFLGLKHYSPGNTLVLPCSASIHRQTIPLLHEHAQFLNLGLTELDCFVDLLCLLTA
jgi:hypothetical protein